jgi:lipopolysaccharide transport system permease protein
VTRAKVTSINEPPEVVIRPQRPSLYSLVVEFTRFRELLYFLVWKNLKVRYAQAVLGAAWALIQPVLTALIIALLLGRVAHMPTEGAAPFVFYLTAMVPWTFFANAVTTAASSLVSNQSLVMKVYFPRLCLPVSGVLSALVDLAVPLVLLLAVTAYYGKLHISIELLVGLPVLLFTAIAAAAGLGAGLSALNLQYRDVNQILPFLIQTLFFASPIVYSATQLPTHWRVIYSLNPMAPVIDGFRAVLIQTHPFSWTTTGVGVASAMAILAIGVLYFERVQHRFADVA